MDAQYAWLLAPVTLPAWTLLLGDFLVVLALAVALVLAAILCRGRSVYLVRTRSLRRMVAARSDRRQEYATPGDVTG